MIWQYKWKGRLFFRFSVWQLEERTTGDNFEELHCRKEILFDTLSSKQTDAAQAIRHYVVRIDVICLWGQSVIVFVQSTHAMCDGLFKKCLHRCQIFVGDAPSDRRRFGSMLQTTLWFIRTVIICRMLLLLLSGKRWRKWVICSLGQVWCILGLTKPSSSVFENIMIMIFWDVQCFRAIRSRKKALLSLSQNVFHRVFVQFPICILPIPAHVFKHFQFSVSAIG